MLWRGGKMAIYPQTKKGKVKTVRHAYQDPLSVYYSARSCKGDRGIRQFSRDFTASFRFSRGGFSRGRGGGNPNLAPWPLISTPRPYDRVGNLPNLANLGWKKLFWTIFKCTVFRFKQILSFSEHGECSTATISPPRSPLQMSNGNVWCPDLRPEKK